jgi:hypothetical protein
MTDQVILATPELTHVKPCFFVQTVVSCSLNAVPVTLLVLICMLVAADAEADAVGSARGLLGLLSTRNDWMMRSSSSSMRHHCRRGDQLGCDEQCTYMLSRLSLGEETVTA